jgi:zinc/manganese transport system substrate-binding protein
MKNLFIAISILMISTISFADKLNVVATYPYIANIVEQIGKDNVSVIALAKGEWDPHTIVPKPSYIGKMRNADLLIMNGAQLEIGWLPPLMRQANNSKIQVGTQGLLDLSKFVDLIEAQSSVSRAQGDIHPDGNPHFYLDFENISKIAAAITQKLSAIDPGNKSTYEKNNNEFLLKFGEKKKGWMSKLHALQGTKIIEYHKLFDYLIRRAGMDLVGTVEPLPGISPTSRHIEELGKLIESNGIKIILQDVYHSDDASVFLSKKYNLKLKVLPHDLGAVKNTDNIISFFDEIVRRLTND